MLRRFLHCLKLERPLIFAAVVAISLQLPSEGIFFRTSHQDPGEFRGKAHSFELEIFDICRGV